mmetsp:Transcript_20184/g.28159  ORF Transcript_20184/g.28159 Transcript_20184/m.28159 type:complete len:299 (-) Transcript_20184:76-972(-)
MQNWRSREYSSRMRLMIAFILTSLASSITSVPGSSVRLCSRVPELRHQLSRLQEIQHKGIPLRHSDVMMARRPSSRYRGRRNLEGRADAEDDIVKGSAENERVPNKENWLDLYAVTATHGLKGEVKASMLTDSHIEEWDHIWFRHPRSGSPVRISVAENTELAKSGRIESIIKIEGSDSKEVAQDFVGGTIFVDATEDFDSNLAEEDAEDDDKWPEMWDRIESAKDVVGFHVLLAATEKVIGQVEDVESNGFQDLLVIRYHEEAEKEGTFLVPFVEALVPIIDTEEEMVVLAEIEGLY